MSRGPKNRKNGGSGRGPGAGYVGGTRPPSGTPPASDATSVFSCLLFVLVLPVVLPLLALFALGVGIVRRR